MRQFLLDTSAFLTLRDDESGADTVADILAKARKGEAEIYGCFITLMEVLYRVWKDEGESEARLAYEQCLSMPVTWIHESRELLEKAAEIKALHPLSLADAWIAASATLAQAKLVHKDPELRVLEVAQLTLPYKTAGNS